MKDEIEALRCSGEKTVACTILLEERNWTKKKKKDFQTTALEVCSEAAPCHLHSLGKLLDTL